MRTLAIDEMEQVGGGALPVLAVVKYALPVLVTAAGGTYLTIRALELAKELCEQGASAQVKSKIVDMSCTAVKKPEGGASSPTQSFGDPGGMLKARFPDATYG